MEPPDLDLSSGFETDRSVEPDGVGDGIPGQIAKCDEPRRAVPPGNGERAVSVFGQDDSSRQNVTVFAVQVEETRQLGKFVVPEQPGVPVDRRSERKTPVESLEDEIVFPEIQAGRKTHPMVFQAPGKTRRNFPGQGAGPMMGGRPTVGHEDVDISLDAFPQRDGCRAVGGAELHPMVLDDEIGTKNPAGFDGPAKEILFLRPQLPGHGIKLEGDEVVVPAERYEHVQARFFFLRSVAEAVGSHPHAQPAAEPGRLFDEGREAARKLGLELLGIQRSVMIGDETPDSGRIGAVIDVAHVERIDVELQAVFIMEPLEKLQIDKRLGFGRPLVLAVDPIKEMGLGGQKPARRPRDRGWGRAFLVIRPRVQGRAKQKKNQDRGPARARFHEDTRDGRIPTHASTFVSPVGDF